MRSGPCLLAVLKDAGFYSTNCPEVEKVKSSLAKEAVAEAVCDANCFEPFD